MRPALCRRTRPFSHQSSPDRIRGYRGKSAALRSSLRRKLVARPILAVAVVELEKALELQATPSAPEPAWAWALECVAKTSPRRLTTRLSPGRRKRGGLVS